MRVGILGCGDISEIYIKNLITRFPEVTVTECASRTYAHAAKTAEKWGIRVVETEQLLNSSQVDCVLLLTPPGTHFTLGMEILKHGKHLYTEKPLAGSCAEGKALLAEAEKAGLRVGCAPDTLFGAGLQTVFEAVRAGRIGKPVAATAHVMRAGNERWHPNPDFFYQQGGGPVMDMGPYSLTALVHLFGDVAAVSAMGRRSGEVRVIPQGKREGQKIAIEVDTLVIATLRFTCGALASVIYSFDTAPSTLPHLELYGETGTILAPDPNTFAGPVLYAGTAENTFRELPLVNGYSENMRGIGVADMAAAILSDTPHKASGPLAYHVLEIMQGILHAADTNTEVRIESQSGLAGCFIH